MKALVNVCALIALFISISAYADDSVLTVRQLPGTQNYEAVLSLDSSVCVQVNQDSSVTVAGSEVTIVSPWIEQLPCIFIPPITYYEITAFIGYLAPGNYTVTWSQPEAFSWSTSLAASSVPCVGCDTLTQAPYPETGSWYNPDQSGSGLNLEIQNGVLAGYYYGYDANGLPEWYLINGPLVRSEQAGLQWELETNLQLFQDGNCIGCDYMPPTGPAVGATIKLEVQQRNYMRVTIGDNPSQFFVPIMYGFNGYAYFSEQTPYVFPEYGDDTFFVLILKPNTDPPMPEHWDSLIVPIGTGKLGSGNAEGKLSYKTWIPQTAPPGPDVSVDFIVCELESALGQPLCKVIIGSKEYTMPIANMGDRRFFGEAEDGSTVEGYRISYD